MEPMYIPVKSIDITKSHLIIACSSIGQSAIIACELLVLNQSAVLVGYFSSVAIIPEVRVDTSSPQLASNPHLSLPGEVYYSETYKITILVLRSGIITGKLSVFESDIRTWIQHYQFSDILVLGTTLASTIELRESNGQNPEFFSTHNIPAKDAAKSINEKEKIFPLCKLYFNTSEKEDAESLYMAGQVPSLINILSQIKVPGYTLLIHSFDGFDLLGGWMMYAKVLDIMNIQSSENIQKKFAVFSLKDSVTIPLAVLYEDIIYPELWRCYIN